MSYEYTTQAQVRKAFKEAHPNLDYKKIKCGDDMIHKTDTRVAFVDYVDHLNRSGIISDQLAERVTL